MALSCLVGNSSWIPIGVATRGSRQNVFLGILNWVFTGGRKVPCSARFFTVPLDLGQTVRRVQSRTSWGEVFGLVLEKLRERWRDVVSTHPSLAPMACGFPGNAWWSWRLRLNNDLGEGSSEKEFLCDLLKKEAGRKGDDSRWSGTELEIGWGNCFWGSWGRCKEVQLA